MKLIALYESDQLTLKDIENASSEERRALGEYVFRLRELTEEMDSIKALTVKAFALKHNREVLNAII